MQESQKMQVWSLGQEDPLEEVMDTPVFLPGEPHGQRSLVGYTVHAPLHNVFSRALMTHSPLPLYQPTPHNKLLVQLFKGQKVGMFVFPVRVSISCQSHKRQRLRFYLQWLLIPVYREVLVWLHNYPRSLLIIHIADCYSNVEQSPWLCIFNSLPWWFWWVQWSWNVLAVYRCFCHWSARVTYIP